jgi:hypothetical protein
VRPRGCAGAVGLQPPERRVRPDRGRGADSAPAPRPPARVCFAQAPGGGSGARRRRLGRVCKVWRSDPAGAPRAPRPAHPGAARRAPARGAPRGEAGCPNRAMRWLAGPEVAAPCRRRGRRPTRVLLGGRLRLLGCVGAPRPGEGRRGRPCSAGAHGEGPAVGQGGGGGPPRSRRAEKEHETTKQRWGARPRASRGATAAERGAAPHAARARRPRVCGRGARVRAAAAHAAAACASQVSLMKSRTAASASAPVSASAPSQWPGPARDQETRQGAEGSSKQKRLLRGRKDTRDGEAAAGQRQRSSSGGRARPPAPNRLCPMCPQPP